MSSHECVSQRYVVSTDVRSVCVVPLGRLCLTLLIDAVSESLPPPGLNTSKAGFHLLLVAGAVPPGGGDRPLDGPLSSVDVSSSSCPSSNIEDLLASSP